MPDEPVQPGNRRFYRRIRNDQWQDEVRQSLQDTAFHLGKNDAGLSVFDTDYATPRAALEEQINTWREIAESPNKSERDHRWANKKLEACGNSVEGLLAEGWGVAVVTEDLFLRYGFQPSPDIDPNGHLEILGLKEAFEEKSLDIIDDPECWVLSARECLA